MKAIAESDITAFRREVLSFWKREGRHDLPWRKTHNPYKILVSEVMLQQTQVPRVTEKYREFLTAFPTVKALAEAPLSAVLRIWNGLGYNRRGKYLHDAAKVVTKQYRGNLKRALAGRLPGVGPYTRAAVRAFAFNEPYTMIETNIRTVFIHHFFPDHSSVSDRELVPLIERAAQGQDPRTWHWALMDYGSFLKKEHKNPSRRSAGYVRQSKFEGSLRQVRGAVLRELHGGPSRLGSLPFDRLQIEQALASLVREGLVTKAREGWTIA